jgi:hypothetical protein
VSGTSIKKFSEKEMQIVIVNCPKQNFIQSGLLYSRMYGSCLASWGWELMKVKGH